MKRFITNGNADVLLVLARSEEGSTDARGLSLFAVETDGSAVVRRLENKIGLRASPTCEIEFRDSPALLLGKRRFGLIRHAMGMMNGARLAVGAQALGIAEGALEEALKYAHTRHQFGQSILNFQGLQWMLADMATQIEAAKALIYSLAHRIDHGDIKDIGHLSAMCKVFASDVAMKVTTDNRVWFKFSTGCWKRVLPCLKLCQGFFLATGEGKDSEGQNQYHLARYE